MISVGTKRALDKAQKYGKTLRSTDPRLHYYVRIIHENGTTYWFENAFLMRWADPQMKRNPKNDARRQGEWLLVFTEHQGVHAFAFDKLWSYGQYEEVSMPPQKLEGE